MTPTVSHAPIAETAVPWSAFRHYARESTALGAALWIVAHGRSMQPRIRSGDRVLVEAPPRRLRAGMILLVDRDGWPVMHRLVRCDGETVVLRPDTIERDDPPVPASAIVGQAVAVSHDGVITPLVNSGRFGAAAWLRYVGVSSSAWRLSARRLARRVIRGAP